MSVRHTVPAVVLGLAATACQSLPEDHGVTTALGRATRRMIDSVTATADLFDVAARDARRIVDELEQLPGATTDELLRVRDGTVDFVDRRIQEAATIGPELARTTGAMFEDASMRIATLPHAPARVGLSFEGELTRARRAVVELPETLGLDRAPFADRTDPSVTTELVPTRRQRSWFERAFDRIGF